QGWIDPAAWDPTVAVYASASRGDGGRDTPHPDSEIIRCEAPDPEPESTSITISGQVTDGDGQPINGAEICANVTWEFFYSCVSSARDGSYAINSVPNGEGTLFVQASGYQAQSLEFTAASENITFNPVLRAYTWISISGVVTDENGQTLPGVRVCLSSMASTGFNCTHTTAQGNYKFQVAERENIPPHDLFSGDRNWAFSSDRFTIDTQEIQINLVAVPRETPTENTTPYFGRVVDSDGNPIMQFAACDVGGRQSECFISNGESNLFELGLWGSDFAVSAQGCPTFNQYLYENFELPEDFDLGTITLDCEVGETPTETPVVTPTTTVPATETPVVT
ncbi:MAG: carboxypeptidase regulatory-like domain-containing protein, partial [Fimbriimonadaceae bacterium]|nr:carboxypeptidase regulatory-like domain-containing protein [Fimbriimonadaceae bacterium]